MHLSLQKLKQKCDEPQTMLHYFFQRNKATIIINNHNDTTTAQRSSKAHGTYVV